MTPQEKINKTEAARRQLETAIKLLFQDDDPISIHTLAFAALNLTHDLCKKDKVTSFFDEPYPHINKPLPNKHFFTNLKKHYNYFRHADKDPDAVLDLFNEKANDSIIFISIENYTNLGNQLTPIMRAFTNWFAIIYYSYLSEDDFDGKRYSAVGKVLTSIPRTEQLKFGFGMMSRNLDQHEQVSEVVKYFSYHYGSLFNRVPNVFLEQQ